MAIKLVLVHVEHLREVILLKYRQRGSQSHRWLSHHLDLWALNEGDQVGSHKMHNQPVVELCLTEAIHVG